MPPKKNPLNLNTLQLRTLTLLQELARLPEHGTPAQEEGAILVTHIPAPHGDHFHIGSAVVMSRDASGLANEAVWAALQRKGLIVANFPYAAVLTRDGIDYETGLVELILQRAHHH